MSYRMTYFRIHADGYMPGWSNQTASDQFDAECRALFPTAGWEVHPGRDGICDAVTKGKQELYLHPQSFSGVILEDEVQPIRELLTKAKTFQCYHVDFYEEYLDINDDEYRALLESRREEITAAILESYKTKRSNLYIVAPVALEIAERFSIRRVCDKENHHNLANRFVGDIITQLLERGLLVAAATRQGEGIRSATAKEKKVFGFLPEQPDTLGNITMMGW